MRNRGDATSLPADWREVRLDELTPTDRPIVYGIVQAGPHVEDGIPYIRSSDVGGRLRGESLPRTSPVIASRYNRSEVAEGDLIFSLRGNIGRMSIVPTELSGANLTQGTARISVIPGVCVQFVKFAIEAPSVVRGIERVAKGSTFREISLAQLRKLKILLPPPAEQIRIASALATWERAEHQVDRVLRMKRRLQRGLMQQLIRGRRRFSEFVGTQTTHHTPIGELPTEWGTARLGQLFRPVKRKNHGGSDRVLTASGRHGLVDQKEYFNRAVAGKSLRNYYLLKKGEFAYNRSTMKGYPYGAIKRLDRYDEGVVSTLYLCFALAADACDADFYMHLFESGLLNRQLRRIAQAGARAHGLLNVSAQDFFNLQVPVPSQEEQQRISRVLSILDEEIRLLREELHCIREQKRGLMQKLLTGQVRVPV